MFLLWFILLSINHIYQLLCDAVEFQYSMEIMAVMLASGVPVNTSKTCFSPLQLAALHGHLTHVDWLLRHGADVEARCKNDSTALDFARVAPDRYLTTLLSFLPLSPALPLPLS